MVGEDKRGVGGGEIGQVEPRNGSDQIGGSLDVITEIGLQGQGECEPVGA